MKRLNMTAPWRSLNLASVRWTVQPAWQTLLLDGAGLRWAEWRQAQRVAVVKQAPHRTVFRIGLEPRAVYVKQYPVAGWRAWLRQWLRPSKARLEWQRTLAAAARTIPTVEPLALGEAKDRTSFLITAEWSDAQTLDAFFIAHQPLASCRLRRRFIAHLGGFLAHLHNMGLRHRDLHAGNILVRQKAGDWELALIDLFAVTLGPALRREERLSNLALFGNWFWQRTSPTDRLCFFRAYLRRQARSGLQRADAKDVEQRTWKQHLAVWSARSPRCLSSNREFQRIRLSNWRGWACREIGQQEAAKWLKAATEQAMACTQTLKASASSRVCKLDERSHSVVIKHFTPRRWASWLASAVRGSAARRSWYAGHQLRTAGIATARPLVYLERLTVLGIPECLLVTEFIADARPLRSTWESANLNERSHLRCRAARLLRRLHQHGLAHRDLKAANWLVRQGSGENPPQLFLVDLVGVTRPWKLTRRRRAANLARFALSFVGHPAATPTECLRFLREYLGPAWQVQWKPWWRRISAAMGEKRDKNRRRGRPLT